MNLNTAMNLYFTHAAKTERTESIYRSVLSNFVEKFGSTFPADALYRDDVERYLESLQVQPSTRTRYKHIIDSFFNYISLYTDLRFTYLRFWGAELDHALALTDNEVQRLLDATADNPRDHAMISLMSDCGLSARSITMIRMRDIENCRLMAIDEFGRRRIMFFKPATRAKLTAWMTLQGCKNYVFVSMRGKREMQLSDYAVRQVVYRAARRANLERQISIEGFYHRAGISVTNILP